MPKPVRIGQFRGERPGTSPRLLPEGYAQSARNCRLIDGSIVPLKQDVLYQQWNFMTEHFATTSDGYESTWQYVRNRKFSRDNLFWTEGAGWTITGGVAIHEPGSAGNLDQGLSREDIMPRLRANMPYDVSITVSSYTAGSITMVVGGTAGNPISSEGVHTQTLTAGDVDDLLSIQATSDADLEIDDISISTAVSSFGGSNWIRLSANEASDNAGEYDLGKVKIVGGTGLLGEEKQISVYHGTKNGKFHVADIIGTWTTPPDDTTIYELQKIMSDYKEVKTNYLFDQGGEFECTFSGDGDLVNCVQDFKNGDGVRFTTQVGTLPTPLSTGTQYFVVNRTPINFQVAATKGGAPIALAFSATLASVYKGVFFYSTDQVDHVRTPLAEDKDSITIFTGAAYPKLTYKGLADVILSDHDSTKFPGDWYTLGVPEPRIDEDEDIGGTSGAGDDMYLYYTQDVNDTALHTDFLGIGWDGATYKNFLVDIAAGVRLGGTASQIGFWIQAAWPKGSVITITNNGTVNGGHGAGGASGGANGGVGGNAIEFEAGFNPALPTPTFDDTTDVITSTAHGLENGMVIHFTVTGGSLPTNISANTKYYVINKTTNTFQISATRGGSAIDFTGTGSGTMNLYAIWIEWTNVTGSLIAAAGGGGGGGGNSTGIEPDGTGWPQCEKISCDNPCCTAFGGAGGKGQGNTSQTTGAAGQTCGSGGPTCLGRCVGTPNTGATGGNGGAYAAVGTSGGNGTSSGGCGQTNGGTAGAAGVAIEGVSNFNVLTNNGTITGTQQN